MLAASKATRTSGRTLSQATARTCPLPHPRVVLHVHSRSRLPCTVTHFTPHATHPSPNTRANAASVHNGHAWGYGKLTVVNDTALTWGFYSAANSTLLDEFNLTKAHAAAPVRLS